MQHFDKTIKPTATGRTIPAAMSHNDLLTLLQYNNNNNNQRLITPPPPTTPATPLLQQLPTTILRHNYHIDDDDDDIDIEAIIAETSFMQPNIATTKVYSDHEINYYSSRYHETNDTPIITVTTTPPTTIDNNNSSTLTTTTITTQLPTTIATIDSPASGFEEPPISNQMISMTAADQQHKPEPHLYHTL